MPAEKLNRPWSFRLGVFLILFSILFFLAIALIPFLDISGRTKVTLSTIALIIGEVSFWTGGILVGKEVLNRYKKYLSPLYWIRKNPEIKLIDTEDLTLKIWSGGTTKQLFIFPYDSDYMLRNFDFRLSTSSIVDKESTFTILPGISRKLMVLDGEITMKHNDQDTKTLRKFDTCSFHGNWTTKTSGSCTDFNIMTTEKYASDLSSLQLSEKSQHKIFVKEKGEWLFLYILRGVVNISGSPVQNLIRAGNMISIKSNGYATIEITALDVTEIVISRIFSS